MEQALWDDVRELREAVTRLRERLNNGISDRVGRLEAQMREYGATLDDLSEAIAAYPDMERRRRRPVVSQDTSTGRLSLHLTPRQLLLTAVAAAAVLFAAVYLGAALAVAQLGDDAQWRRVREIPETLRRGAPVAPADTGGPRDPE